MVGGMLTGIVSTMLGAMAIYERKRKCMLGLWQNPTPITPNQNAGFGFGTTDGSERPFSRRLITHIHPAMMISGRWTIPSPGVQADVSRSTR
jgi:hypothetical protein